MDSSATYFDVIIIGAGLSGIGAAHHLQEMCPDKSYAILEARNATGGTWDLFKYPGIRSDSDMYTLGYSFKPWKEAKAIADGPAILNYIRETAEEGGINQHIRFNNKVKKISWNDEESRWTVSTNTAIYTCNFIVSCCGYYNYDEGYTPDFAGSADFKGTIVHPQKWDTNLNYDNKKIIVIGSGATAVTLVPELAKKAAHVTMLQRSPSYVLSQPAEDKIANGLRKILPSKIAYSIARWKNITTGLAFYSACKKWPNFFKKLLMKGVKKEVGDDVDVHTHFNPPYNPWQQRLCLVPDNDLFESLKDGKANVVTDHIETFTEKGIKLVSGNELDADIIVTATGLKLLFLGGAEMEVNGNKINPPDLLCYRGMMFNDVPNLVVLVGYTNASWTLKCDLSCEYFCRLLKRMDKTNTAICYPKLNEQLETEPLIDFNSGYVLRALNEIPKQGKKRPWKVFQNYILDMFNFKYSSLNDDVMTFR